MNRCPLSLLAVLAAGALAAEGEIRDVDTLEALRGVEPIRLGDGWTVRLGLGDGGAEAGPWKLLYCLAKHAADAEEPTLSFKAAIPGDPLGPVLYRLHGDTRVFAKAMRATVPREALYCAVLLTAWPGRHPLRVLSPDGRLLAGKDIEVARPGSCDWAEFAAERRVAVKGALRWVVRRGARAAVPQFGELAWLWTPKDDLLKAGGARHPRPLPGTIPSAEPVGPLRLALEDDAFVLRSRLRMILLPDDHLLARWWVNGEPATPPRADPAAARWQGRPVAQGTGMKVAFALPAHLGKLKAGDRVGLQVLYSPGRLRALPKGLTGLTAHFTGLPQGRRDVARVPLLSNRLEFVLTRELLDWPGRRAGEETDF